MYRIGKGLVKREREREKRFFRRSDAAHGALIRLALFCARCMCNCQFTESRTWWCQENHTQLRNARRWLPSGQCFVLSSALGAVRVQPPTLSGNVVSAKINIRQFARSNKGISAVPYPLQSRLSRVAPIMLEEKHYSSCKIKRLSFRSARIDFSIIVKDTLPVQK